MLIPRTAHSRTVMRHSLKLRGDFNEVRKGS